MKCFLATHTANYFPSAESKLFPDDEVDQIAIVSSLSEDTKNTSTQNLSIMESIFVLPLVALTLIDLVISQEPFCYSDVSCGPTSEEWGGVCHSGTRQSPIVLPAKGLSTFGATYSASIKLNIYKSNTFRMVNTGHSVQVDFNSYHPVILLPDPVNLNQFRAYRFSSAHFHWGTGAKVVGSEHCVGTKCASMELHLVHYLAIYGSQAAAVASGDENALAVIAVLIDRTVGESIAPVSLIKPKGTGPLAPIVNNMRLVEEPDHTGTEYVAINQALDLSKLIYETGIPGVNLELYTYKGSLTTPGCNEQVNWYVMKKPARTSKYNLQAFRSIPKDNRGQTLVMNHRPVQPLNGRTVNKVKVLP